MVVVSIMMTEIQTLMKTIVVTTVVIEGMVRFNKISRVYDSGNALKQRIGVNGTYVDFVI